MSDRGKPAEGLFEAVNTERGTGGRTLVLLTSRSL